MSYHILHYRLKKLKRAFLIWITLISLLINLWIDNIRFTIFQTKSNERSRVQIKRARWFTNQLIKLGSASLAQVHRATLKDGKKVVFKVQRPNLKELFIIDLGIMQQIACLLYTSPSPRDQ